MHSYARERRARREAECRAQDEARWAEEQRVAGLSMWERINEISTGNMGQVREILRLFDERLDALEGKTA
jgi:hypothetical protein